MAPPKTFLTGVWVGYGGKNRRHSNTLALREYIKSEVRSGIVKPIHVYFYVGSIPQDCTSSEIDAFIDDLNKHMSELEGKS